MSPLVYKTGRNITVTNMKVLWWFSISVVAGFLPMLVSGQSLTDLLKRHMDLSQVCNIKSSMILVIRVCQPLSVGIALHYK